MKKVLILLALALSVATFAACGDDDDDGDTAATTAPSNGAAANGGGGGGAGGGGGGQVLKLAADPSGELAFDTDQLNAKAGNITIEFDNPAPVPHNVEVENDEELGVSDTISEDTTTLELTDVQPGEYVFYCNVPGHREGGMEGTLTVK